jgi:hypothetical protein
MAKPQNNDGWIEWKGGKCPVADDVLVNWRLREYDQSDFDLYDSWSREASGLDWQHSNVGWDIVAYRLHQPTKEI